MNIGRPQRIIEVEPVSLPIPEVLPEVVPESELLPDHEPSEPAT